MQSSREAFSVAPKYHYVVFLLVRQCLVKVNVNAFSFRFLVTGRRWQERCITLTDVEYRSSSTRELRRLLWRESSKGPGTSGLCGYKVYIVPSLTEIMQLSD